jgi:hypothetical protein
MPGALEERTGDLVLPDAGTDPHTWTVVLVSAAMGGLLGLFVYPAPQFTLEAAQVVGGVVQLPDDNPMRIFDTSAYSLFLIQIPALLLAAGVSASTLSLLLSAAQGAVAFSAVALVTLALSRSAVLSLLTPLLLLHVHLVHLSHKYPIYFPTDRQNGPLLGFYGVLAAISLIALRKERSGSFLLGLLPAANPILGVAGWLAAGVGLLAERRRYAGLLRRTWPYFAAGAGLFAVTFAVQMAAIRDVPEGIPGETATSLTAEFMRHWDVHRMPYFATGLSTPVEFFDIDAAFVILATLCLTTFRHSVPSSARLLLIGLLAVTVVATAFTLIDEKSPGFFPVPVKELMITRWLNWNSVAVPVLVISLLGVLGIERRSIVGLLGLVLVGAAIAWGAEVHSALAAAGLLALLAYAWMPPLRRGVQSFLDLSYKPDPSRLVSALGVAACAALLIVAISGAHDLKLPRLPRNEGNPVWAEARRGEGLIVVAPPINNVPVAPWPQLRTRRGILLDPWLMDNMSYAPAMAPGIEEILRDVYGTSIRDPATWSSFARTKRLWEGWTVKDWQAIARKYGANEVIAKNGWDIRLPAIARGNPVSLYRIPNAPR